MADSQGMLTKVECTACGSRYSLPRARLKGRVLKIRCKSCNKIFEVRDDSAVRSVRSRGQRCWFVVLRRERLGPYTAQEIRERFSRGELSGRSFIWRQGMAEWSRLGVAEEFADLSRERDDDEPAALSPAVRPAPKGPGGRSPTLPLVALGKERPPARLEFVPGSPFDEDDEEEEETKVVAYLGSSSDASGAELDDVEAVYVEDAVTESGFSEVDTREYPRALAGATPSVEDMATARALRIRGVPAPAGDEEDQQTVPYADKSARLRGRQGGLGSNEEEDYYSNEPTAVAIPRRGGDDLAAFVRSLEELGLGPDDVPVDGAAGVTTGSTPGSTGGLRASPEAAAVVGGGRAVGAFEQTSDEHDDLGEETSVGGSPTEGIGLAPDRLAGERSQDSVLFVLDHLAVGPQELAEATFDDVSEPSVIAQADSVAPRRPSEPVVPLVSFESAEQRRGSGSLLWWALGGLVVLGSLAGGATVVFPERVRALFGRETRQTSPVRSRHEPRAAVEPPPVPSHAADAGSIRVEQGVAATRDARGDTATAQRIIDAGKAQTPLTNAPAAAAVRGASARDAAGSAGLTGGQAQSPAKAAPHTKRGPSGARVAGRTAPADARRVPKKAARSPSKRPQPQSPALGAPKVAGRKPPKAVKRSGAGAAAKPRQALTPAEVRAAVKGLGPAVNKCAGEDGGGFYTVELVVAGATGRVQRARLVGALVDAEVSECVAKVLRIRLRFAPFARPTQQFRTPLVLR